VTLKQALAMSLNTVSVRLTMEVTPAAVVRTAHRLGIASKLEPNASIALGTSEVSVLELVAAYAPLRQRRPFRPAARGRTRANRKRQAPVRARARRTSAASSSRARRDDERMMQETLITGTARKADVPGWPAAGKTGTSQDFRDAWFVGYTGHLVAGVWLGNDDGKPTRRTTGGGLPAEIWSKFMRQVHQGVPVAALPGASRGPQNASLLPPIGAPFGPPPAPIPNRQAEERPAPAGGIDNWLIDRLFGRR
jgi:penicillin-binding protein 1A